jgi:hypothetical protein
MGKGTPQRRLARGGAIGGLSASAVEQADRRLSPMNAQAVLRIYLSWATNQNVLSAPVFIGRSPVVVVFVS